MQIALFGGKFDPPHLGHIHISKYILQAGLGIDAVWFVPANTHPWRPIVASAQDRLEMAQLLVKGSDSGYRGVTVSDIDIKRGGDTYTIDTVRELFKTTDNTYCWIF